MEPRITLCVLKTDRSRRYFERNGFFAIEWNVEYRSSWYFSHWTYIMIFYPKFFNLAEFLNSCWPSYSPPHIILRYGCRSLQSFSYFGYYVSNPVHLTDTCLTCKEFHFDCKLRSLSLQLRWPNNGCGVDSKQVTGTKTALAVVSGPVCVASGDHNSILRIRCVLKSEVRYHTGIWICLQWAGPGYFW